MLAKPRVTGKALWREICDKENVAIIAARRTEKGTRLSLLRQRDWIGGVTAHMLPWRNSLNGILQVINLFFPTSAT